MPATDTDIEDFKLINNETGNYSDRCSGCGHTRSMHLANPAGLNIFALGTCTFEKCTSPISDAHPKHGADCVLVACGDNWSH